jgi:uncharacterized cupin superfamily protein
MARHREEAAMEHRPGLFVSSTATEDWEADPDVPGSEVHELVHDGTTWAGMTRVLDAPEPMPWTPEQRETLIVLEGSVRIVFADGTDLAIGVGDMVSIPAGEPMTWHVTTPFKEMWVLTG